MISSVRPSSHRLSKNGKKFQRQTTLKWIRTLLFETVNYVQINSPPFRFVAILSRFYFFSSIFSFAILPHCSEIYPAINLSNSITKIITTFFMLLYPDSDLYIITIISSIIIAIFIVFAIIFLSSVIVFNKNAKIPKPLLYIIGLGILLGPLYINIVFLYLSHLVGDIIINGLQYHRSISLIIILSLIILLYFPFYYSFLSPTIYFKPKTIIFYSSQSEKFFYLSLHLFTFFSVSFSRSIDSLPSIILTYLSLPILLVSILCFIFEYDFVLMYDYYYHLPLLITSFLTLLIVNSFRVSDYLRIRDGKEIITSPTYFLFLVVIFYFLITAVIRSIIGQMKKKCSEKLDNIEETGIQSESQFFRLLRFGFEVNHPKCYDWSIFTIGFNSIKSKRIMICYF